MAEQWILDIAKEIELPHTPPDDELSTKSIYRVPKILTDVNCQAYQPKLASFGPFHHDSPHLRPMEEHKHRALTQFLRRIANPAFIGGQTGQTPEDVLIAMRKIQPRLLASYDSLEVTDEDAFLKLMILDSCFTLEVMLAETRSAAGEYIEYNYRDPVFGIAGRDYVIPDLKRDMLLLENQLPFLALTTLANIYGSGIGDVNKLIKAFYNISSKEDYKIFNRGLNGFHVLDVYRKILTAEGGYLPNYEENRQSTAELKSAGVSFSVSNSYSYRDINFKDGILSLPLLFIDDNTESLLLNLMAFEHLHPTAGNEVTAYAFFMNRLINTAYDVDLLRNENIIIGLLGCDEYIVEMFNNITKEMTLVIFKKNLSIDVNRELNRYCGRRMLKVYRARLTTSFAQRYLKSPWAFISLLGTLALFVFAMLQALYSMLQYYTE